MCACFLDLLDLLYHSIVDRKDILADTIYYQSPMHFNCYNIMQKI